MMSRTAAAVRRAKDRESGFSLAEVLVVMLVMGILGTAVSALFITSIRATTATSKRLDQSNAGRTAMDTITRALRTAVLPSSLANCPVTQPTCGSTDAFIQGGPFLVQFYADIDNPNNTIGPSQVTFSVDANGNLLETLQPPDPGSATTGYTWTACVYKAPGCSLRENLLATNVVTTGKSLFTYYVYGSTTPVTGNLSGSQLRNVDSVDVILNVTSKNSKTIAPTTYVNRVALPNVDTVVQASISAGG
jgi:prepilin-type N-terminal cleavage/methylation domain-containing protein